MLKKLDILIYFEKKNILKFEISRFLKMYYVKTWKMSFPTEYKVSHLSNKNMFSLVGL